MFDFVRKHTRLFQFALLILILPSFVLLGVEGYSRFIDGSNTAVGTVDGRKITQAEWDAAHRSQVERMRQQMPQIDAKLLDSPELKLEALNNLLRERVLFAAAQQQHLAVTDAVLEQAIKTDPQLAVLRGPDGKLNKAVLAAQGMTADMLVQRMRQDMLLNQVLGPVGQSGTAQQASAKLVFDALLQQREVQIKRFEPAAFAAQLAPTDAELETYYKDAKVSARFKTAESADIEYLVLELDALKSGVQVSADDVRKFYDENVSRYTMAEERRASHILINGGTNAQEKAKARERAQELLAQVRKNPASFAEVARKNSQDEGSAARGGDLDFFARGAMVKPFEDAAYALKTGEISELVESDFGFHIIQLTGVRGGEKRPFEAVRGEIEEEQRRQLAQKRYAELAEQFSNIVYEQSDSLQPAADKFKLTLQKASVQRQPAAGAQGPLASPKLLDAVFGAESLKSKRNTEAVETAPSQLVAARVVTHHPAVVPALAGVKDAVRQGWIAQRASELAKKAGEQALAQAQKGSEPAGLSEPQVLSRAKPGTVPPKVLEHLLRADAAKLPAYTGVEVDGAYVLARVNKLLPRDAAVVDDKRAAEQYAAASANAEAQAYFAAIKTSLKASIKPAAAATAAASASAASAP
ncbi:SurA N-terminal domain-containing protein [Roseateles sp. BYS180W]|uniref:Periplasmic chaperone PpiD n=1 Tax=Roseateles rivi TaxID=3299028 RepID=A0ABW7FV54_9BURK